MPVMPGLLLVLMGKIKKTLFISLGLPHERQQLFPF
jgi:hypothetical protein